jgi:hypothetical protein
MKRNEKIYPVIVASVLLISVLMFSTSVSAAAQNPCTEDIAKFCKDVKPGQMALMECLEQHEAQLSDACKAYEAKMERPRGESREVVAQLKRVRQACNEEIIKFCNDSPPVKGGISTCLKSHASELSGPCGEALKAVTEGEKTNK